MTFWDFLCSFIEHGGIAWTLLTIAAVGFVWIIIHPAVVKEWNVQISIWIARIIPKKRKRAFEKRIDLTVDSAKTKFAESMPKHMKQFLPYSLKVEWVNENETLETVLKDKQVIVYVPSYKDEIQQTIGVLHNYCTIGFAEKAKVYLPSRTKDASDLIMTGKLAQSAGHHVYDYFNREYLPEILKKNHSYATAYERLKKVDTDGLFLPVFINEVDKYANRIYPATPSDETEDVIVDFSNFIYTIVTRKPGERVNLTFCKGDINVRIVLAVSDSIFDANIPVNSIEESIKGGIINTIYILATGSKMAFANDIATSVYERNLQDVYEPIITQYKRRTRKPSGSDAICYEINVRQ